MKSAIRVILWIAGLFLFTNHIAYAQNWTLPTPSQEACHPAIIPQPKFIASTRKTIDFTELSILFSGSVDCSTQQKVKREVIDISNSLKFTSVRKKHAKLDLQLLQGSSKRMKHIHYKLTNRVLLLRQMHLVGILTLYKRFVK